MADEETNGTEGTANGDQNAIETKPDQNAADTAVENNGERNHGDDQPRQADRSHRRPRYPRGLTRDDVTTRQYGGRTRELANQALQRLDALERQVRGQGNGGDSGKGDDDRRPERDRTGRFQDFIISMMDEMERRGMFAARDEFRAAVSRMCELDELGQRGDRRMKGRVDDRMEAAEDIVRLARRLRGMDSDEDGRQQNNVFAEQMFALVREFIQSQRAALPSSEAVTIARLEEQAAARDEVNDAHRENLELQMVHAGELHERDLAAQRDRADQAGEAAKEVQRTAETAQENARETVGLWRFSAVLAFVILAVILAVLIAKGEYEPEVSPQQVVNQPVPVNQPVQQPAKHNPEVRVVDNRPHCSVVQTVCSQATAEDNPNAPAICAMAANCQ